MYERRQLYYYQDTGTSGDYRQYVDDYRQYVDDYENGRKSLNMAQCAHCGSNAEYVNNLGDLTCSNKTCTTNRHKNDDGSRNYGEARAKSGQSKYLLIG